jgi:MFS family permease
MKFLTKEDVKNSFYDGMFANMFTTLTGGMFLTGFAIYLGMNESLIGVVAAMPFIVTVFQLPVSYLIEKKGRRKRMVLWGAGIARITWLLILTAAMLPVSSPTIRYLLIVGLIFISYAFLSAGNVAWLSWTSELIPDEILGNFFGTRNMLCALAGLIATMIFGNLLDFMKNYFRDDQAAAFSVIFVSAVVFGVLSLYFLNRVSEPRRCAVTTDDRSFRKLMELPLKIPNFRNFLLFVFLWNFSIYFATPFFTLYWLRDLQFSYSMVAILGMLSSFADIAGMKFWGVISDKVGNKAVIRVTACGVVILPLIWVCVKPDNIILPVLLHIGGGGVWAGVTLCTGNLMLRISPRDNRSFFLSLYNIAGGFGAAAAPILSGLALSYLIPPDIHILSGTFIPLHIVFLLSALMRLGSLFFLRYVREPGESSLGETIRILRKVRVLNMRKGFSHILHPFMEISKYMSQRNN